MRQKQAGLSIPYSPHLEGEQIGEALQSLHAPVHIVPKEQKLSGCNIHS